MLNILTAVPSDGLPAVEVACAEAPEHGVHLADVILNTRACRRDPPIPALTTTLTLIHEPVADCHRHGVVPRQHSSGDGQEGVLIESVFQVLPLNPSEWIP